MALELNLIYNMDCREGLKLLEDNSIDSIVTDPPYELGFMGKSWDKTGIAYNVELWHECLRVLKPGGHLLAFGGTRTYHRMACAIEDAGFEIRDQIQWIYGSGFPKSMDISKAIDKKLGAKRKTIGQAKSGKTAGMQNLGPSGIKGGEYNITIPATPEAQQWDGWGTGLKPANEPICVARKPLSEKTVADNVLKWGTGGINIDGCRVGTEIHTVKGGGGGVGTGWGKKNEINKDVTGRFPANVILDEEAGRLLDEQSGISKSNNKIRRNNNADNHEAYNCYGKYGNNETKGYTDSVGASRFFYCAKASRKERNIGLENAQEVIRNDGRNPDLKSGDMPHNRSSNPKKNFHPTVKPLKLIKYLITLVTPSNGVCLDPFEGSGTHALACINLGFNFIGFELNKDYYNIAIARINHAKQHTRQISLIE